MSWLNTVTQKERTTPKTSLAFYNIFVGICFTGAAGLITALAFADAPMWTMVAAGAVPLAFVAIVLLTVVALNVKSPEKLMLGQVSATDYTKITETRATLGDARSGLNTREVSAGEDNGADPGIIDAEIVDEGEQESS